MAPPHFVGLHFQSSISAGNATLELRFGGTVSSTGNRGVFKSRDGDVDYLFTQFAPIEARRAFPCFDEPGFKTPWRVTLHVERAQQAFANAPQISETPEAGGMKRVSFAPTRPLPTYLVAFAVGPFEIVNAGTAGKKKVPVRIITPKGKAHQAKYAAEATGQILEQLEQYFGIPYPYEKADQVAVPLVFGFGAMENAGLVTYAASIILSEPSLDSESRQRSYAVLAAHELAHHWFGNLVTLAWWDDTWLNEAFATWMASKVIGAWRPQWDVGLEALNHKFSAVAEDSLLSTRKVRQQVGNTSDISNSFSSISYQKGAAVIGMFENWVGAQDFRKGVTSYLRRYADRNASAHDFLDAIANTGQPRLTKAFSSHLDQPGIAQVSIQLRCEGKPAVTLSQKRHLPVSSSADGATVWQTPVCFRYEGSRGPQRECFLLDREKQEFTLSRTSSCPANYSANDSGLGYYLTAYAPDYYRKALEPANGFLNASERLTILHDLQRMAESGDVPHTLALSVIPQLAQSREPQIVLQAMKAVADIQNMVPASLQPSYARFVRRAFGDKARELTWSAKPDDNDLSRLLRPVLLWFVAGVGEDQELQAQARTVAERWLTERKGVDSSLIIPVLASAANAGDSTLYQALLSAIPKTNDPVQRQALFFAVGSFRDQQIAGQARGIVLSDAYDTRESLTILLGDPLNPDTPLRRFDFIRRNYEKLLPRLPFGGPVDGGALLPGLASGLCSQSAKEMFQNFFGPRMQQFNGGPLAFSQALEKIAICEQKVARYGPNVEQFLRQPD